MPLISSLGSLKPLIDIGVDANNFTNRYWISYINEFQEGSTFTSTGYYYSLDETNKEIINQNDRGTILSTSLMGSTSGFNLTDLSSIGNVLFVPRFGGNSSVGSIGLYKFNQFANSGNIIRANISPNVSPIVANAIVDGTGNIFLGGSGSNTRGLISKFYANNSIVWQKNVDFPTIVGPPTDRYTVKVNSIVSDGNNVYVAGFGERQIGTGTVTFIMKLDSNGNIIWKRSAGNVQEMKLADSNANLVYLGETTSGNITISVSKLDTANGLTRYVVPITNNVYPNTNTLGTSLDVDENGNIVIGGQYTSNTAPTPDQRDAFLIGLYGNLTQRFIKKIDMSYPGASSRDNDTLSITQNAASNTIYFQVRNYDQLSYWGLNFKVPYNGTSPGTGNYSIPVGNRYVVYQDTTEMVVGTASFGNLVGNSNVFLDPGNATMSTTTFALTSASTTMAVKYI